MYAGWTVGLSQIFTKRKSVAFGLAWSGSGIGVLALGPAFTAFMGSYDWKTTMQLCAFLKLSHCLFAVVLGAEVEASKESRQGKTYDCRR